jgi:hypothetical protein
MAPHDDEEAGEAKYARARGHRRQELLLPLLEHSSTSFFCLRDTPEVRDCAERDFTSSCGTTSFPRTLRAGGGEVSQPRRTDEV